VDPIVVILGIHKKFDIRPLVVEYMYYTPIAHWFLKKIDSLPIPNFNVSSNSVKKKRSDKVIREVTEGIKRKENFLIYPAGRLKSSAYEAVGGSSGVHQILEESKSANVVLVRTKGLWGSAFSKAFEGTSPNMFKVILNGFKTVFKNLIFFTPRRHIIVEFEPAGADFPFNGSRMEVNKYLEGWFNRPDGLTKQEGEYPGDSLVLVSYSIWKDEFPVVAEKKESFTVDLKLVPKEAYEKVINKLSEMSRKEPNAILPNMNLSSDLGLDSLDIAELMAFLKDEFDASSVPALELTTVEKVLGIASKQIVYTDEKSLEELKVGKKGWKDQRSDDPVHLNPAESIIETFFDTCDRMKGASACADMISGVLTYNQMKMRAILLAEVFRKFPGERIGILLPASVASVLSILACQLAGKVPVMINWTVGPRHLQSVMKSAPMDVILTSWSFIDRLENADLDGVEDLLVMLEDLRREISLSQKIRAAILARCGRRSIIKKFNFEEKEKSKPAVILFTSGTESLPKGVPLSHKNILSNIQSAAEVVHARSNDVLLGMLPPFHSFGFTVCGMLPLLLGMRVVFYPDPTNGKALAANCEIWGVTVVCSAPTFLKGILKAAEPNQLKTLRLCVAGAEKTPADLVELMANIGKKECLFEGYGITECSPILTFQDEKRIGVGKLLPGIEACIVNPETLQPLSMGERGLILVRGPNIFHGYLNGKERASPFIELNGVQWYSTGDLGFLDSEGNLTLSGRMKRFVKIGAEMISLGALEDAIHRIAIKKEWPLSAEGPSIAVAAKEVEGEKPKIFLFAKFAVSLDELNQLLKEEGMSNIMRISDLQQLSEIPIMGTGKINYRQLEETYIK
jgi:long-chain-fatty-acid--[acyl-carrier-protein] ligase